MRIRVRNAINAAALLAAAVPLQNPPAPAAITPRLDTPQVRVIVATLQPHTPSIAANGHATSRVLIYLDDGAMTRTEEGQSARIEFHRGDVRWRPASGAYTAENVSDHPIRILEVDMKSRREPPAAEQSPARLDPAIVDPAHYKVVLDNEYVRVLRIHFGPHEKSPLHEHTGNRVVVYLNDQAGGKADDVRVAAAATHTEENMSDKPADRIAVELK
jgi:hypothetical protein